MNHTRTLKFISPRLLIEHQKEREDPLHGRAHFDGVINYITGYILIGREGGGGSSPTASTDERAGERSTKSNKLLLMQEGLRKMR